MEAADKSAENLLVLGVNTLKLPRDRMPLHGLTWFRHGNDTLCAVISCPNGVITTLYGVKKNFVKLVSDITERGASRVVPPLGGTKILKFCRAYVADDFTPETPHVATISVFAAGGSKRASAELASRVIPDRGLFVETFGINERSPLINVGIVHDRDEGRSFFIDCDNDHQKLRDLTPDEVVVAHNVLTNDEIASLYYTGEARHGFGPSTT